MPKQIRLTMSKAQMGRAARMLQNGNSMAGVARDMGIPRNTVERQMKAYMSSKKDIAKDTEQPPAQRHQNSGGGKAAAERSPKSSHTMLSVLCSPWTLPEDSPLHKQLEEIEQERVAEVARKLAADEAELEEA